MEATLQSVIPVKRILHNREPFHAGNYSAASKSCQTQSASRLVEEWDSQERKKLSSTRIIVFN